MNAKNISLLAAMILLVTTSNFAQKKAGNAPIKKGSRMHVHKVVVQLSTADTLEHKGFLNNLKNLKEGWGDSVQVEVVVHGPGIDLVTKGKSTGKMEIQMMMEKGVRFVVCRNTMKQRNISEEQIIPNVGFVQMGVGEIILKQEQGWSYLKAGF
jgi:intracellular sulfur oxidation DsrE/DsrF family protein